MTGEVEKPRLLSDASVPINFVTAGPECADAFKEYFGDKVLVAIDVYEELERKARTEIPELKQFLDGWPELDPIDLPMEVKSDVAKILRLNIGIYHPDKDRGETATILYAEHARDRSVDPEEFELLLDDGDGKKFARDRSLGFWDTPTIALHMVCSGYLTEDQGFSVWCAALTDPEKHPAYWTRLEEVRARDYS